MFLSPERIDKIRNKIFVSGFFLDDLFFVFDNYFVIGYFDNFLSWNSEFGVRKTFDKWAFHDNLLNSEIFAGDGKVYNVTEFRALFSLDFEAGEFEIEVNDLADFNDVVFCDKLFDRIDDAAVARVFADGLDV